MVEPKRYQKKKRIYTRWDKQTEEVKILREKKVSLPAIRRFTDDISGLTVEEKNIISNYAREVAIYSREGEFVLDFLNPDKDNKLKLVSRIILSPVLAKKILEVLEER